ncbi:hypothetical protein [Taibaiella chishuiensis]|uniref:Uncharacterized protein n=1 Tax=Taibaiella chishuiensis TaxID=1434707 RepID=A0A2P8DAD2_9BACT|nr:hypothetical protein [Taibaiella chishuiensis]PSK94169.1 hypothetical protein B0I18_101322 [Taibaiella chishuiensis]
MNKIIAYFDLASQYRPMTEHAVNDGRKFPVIPQYIALLIGILAQPIFQSYKETGEWHLSANWGWFVGSMIVSLMAFPAIYKNSFDANKPLFVQLCVIFTAGIGWQNITTVAEHLTK